MNRRPSRLILVWGLIVLASQLSLAEPVQWEQNGHYYELTEAMAWSQAEEQAIEWGGHLVTINDREEELWLRAQFGSYEYFWIGFNDIHAEGNWEWVSGEPVTYTNWWEWEPNNEGAYGEIENAAIMNWGGAEEIGGEWFYYYGDGWNDNAVDNEYRGIVEIFGKVKVLLTFDDGPDGDEHGRFNSTSSVLSTLNTNSVKSGIKATFFTLTDGHNWGGTKLGIDLLCEEYANGHVVSVHQGGQGAQRSPHVLNLHTDRVKEPAYPVGPNGEVLKKGDPVGLNGLESDLVAAIRRLRFLFGDSGYNPEFVRPPMYIYGDDGKVLAAYSSEAVKTELHNEVGLKMILTDMKGTGDGGGFWWPFEPSPSTVSATLKDSVKNCIEREIYEIVLTLHDSNNTTAKNLDGYLNDIREAAQEEGYVVEFVTSDSEARQILRNRWAAGDWQGG